MKATLAIPEEHLPEVIGLLRDALAEHDDVTPEVREALTVWCDDQAEYLNDYSEPTWMSTFDPDVYDGPERAEYMRQTFLVMDAFEADHLTEEELALRLEQVRQVYQYRANQESS